jgi:phosphoribosylaminoimidazole carboxylase / phosphoribosylaminoimidazole-succinocarboxamide synthase
VSGGEDDDNNEMLVRRAQMIPLEVVTRGVAAGSFVKRRPGIARGAILVPRIIEFFFKDDANHDPLLEPDAVIAQNIATPQELGVMSEIARIVYEILAHAWRRHDTLLVDLKIEFGRIASGENKGQLVVADVIDNDAWRVWPQGREELMLDKQRYRNLPVVTPEDLDIIRANYETVAETVGTFPLMRPGMVAVIADGPEFVERAGELQRTLSGFGLPTVRHVASAARTPGYVLQLVTQIDATFARALIVTVGSGDGLLANMVEYATATPVVRAPANADAQLVALQCAKAFALEDTIVFGRVLLVQANTRSTVLQADATLNAAPTA